MKRCPQCSRVYQEDIQFCLDDGTALIGEDGFTQSDEEETVIHHDPITIDLNPPTPQPQVVYQTVQPPVQAVSPGRNPLLFLLLGLAIGGGLVLAAMLLARSIYRDAATPANSTTPTPMQTPLPSPSPSKTIESTTEHDKPDPNADEDELNGRVISANAYVRSAPNADAPIVDMLPVDDRLNIGTRAKPNSPWYEVTCEHGTTGWMHGNTIEFAE